jgi:uncharacterized protein YbbC (DUF1343 family)
MRFLISLLCTSVLLSQSNSFATADAEVLTGLDVLVRDHFAAFSGKHVGLITNHTGLSIDGKRNIDLMLAAGVQVLFSPEHGFAGVEDQPNVADAVDPATIEQSYSDALNHFLQIRKQYLLYP